MEPEPQRLRSAGRPGLSGRLAITVWIAAALASARGLTVFAMDHWGRGNDAALCWVRVSDRLPGVTLHAVFAAAIGLAAFTALRRSGPGALAAGALAAAAYLTVLSGWPLDDPYHVPDPGSARGRVALLGLSLAALVASAVHGFALGRARVFGNPLWLVAGLALLVGQPLGVRYWKGRLPETMPLRVVVRDLLADEDALALVHAAEDRRAARGTLTPGTDFRFDVGEKPAILLPPPASASFEVTEQDGPVRLHAACGVDLEVYEAAPAGLEVAFEVRVDGETVFEHRVRPAADTPPEARAWAHVGGEEGLALRPGARVELATRLVSGDAPAPGAGRASAEAVGFGGMTLERRSERTRTRASAEHPNIVLIVMDTLRADRMSCYGYERETTPNVDRLAAEGVRFEAASVPSSWTWPSTASILTGLLPQAHGVTSARACYLARELETLSEVLQREGYTTAAYSGNPLISATRNFDQGFETFDATPRDFLTSDLLMPRVLDWLDRNARVRFFLYLQLVDPHEPHRPLPEHRARFAPDEPADLPERALTHYTERLFAGEGRTEDGWDAAGFVPREHLAFLSDIYDASVATGDAFVGRLLDKLDALGLRENTLVVFTSDHGEELGEHGLLKHGHSLYGELVRAPLVLRGPGVPAGRTVPTPVSNRHLAPTLARVGGARMPGLSDALDLLDFDALPTQPVLFATDSGCWSGEVDRPVRGVWHRGHALHYLHAEDDGEGGVERILDEGRARLYDLGRDPGETQDVLPGQRALARDLLELLLRRERELLELRPSTLQAGRETMRMLQNTGYAGTSDD